ncbi:MAG TPA: thioesterase domain-containing protein, partial [Bryobacteraceae bacterium]|nr:thioesterase domain-containing protein [Bryobacteraceae bacterium]
ALNPASSGSPLFLIPGVDGKVDCFLQLVQHLRRDRPVYAIRSQAFVRGARARTRVEDQAAYYIQEIQRVQPDGPYQLVGFSFGGLIALEVAQQLRSRSQPTALLGIVDNLPMRSSASQPSGSGGAAQHLKALVGTGGLKYMLNKLGARALRTIYTILDTLKLPIPDIIKRPYDVNWFAAVRYVPRTYAGRVTLFQTSTSALERGDAIDLWIEIANGGVDLHELPGSHETLLTEPNVALLAGEIEACLAKLE